MKRQPRMIACIIIILVFFLTGTIVFAQAPDPTPDPATATPTATGQIPYQINGDVNTDRQIDIVDALLIAQYYVGMNPDNFNPSVADVNDDDEIDIVDALLVAQYYVGIIPGF